MKTQGKIAIITGSSRGIGKAIAWRLGKEGAKVVINGREEYRLSNTLAFLHNEGIEASACVADVSRPEDCRKLIEHACQTFGGIDILVNNAGIGSRGFFENTDPEVFRQVVDINLLGSIYPTHEALPYLKKNSGSVIFISSLAGFHGMPNRSHYCMTKMAQTALAESLHNEIAPQGVHVGIIYVNSTVNDPEKLVLNGDGSWAILKERSGVWVDTQDDVARAVLTMLERRHFKTIVGIKGKAYYLLQKLAPWFVDYTFQHSKDKIMELDK